jgi:hypothetical protein
MAKIFQVRYTVSDKVVAHEHYTEKGAKSDSKALSKVIGNATLGEIDVGEDGSRILVRTTEFIGGEVGKPIKRDGPPSHVEVIKSADDTRQPESMAEKKPKAPKMTDEEKIAAKRKEYEEGLAAIEAGTFIIKAPGRKAGPRTPSVRKPKEVVDKSAAIMEALGCSEKAAKILTAVNLNKDSRRTKVALAIINAERPILASQVMAQLNEKESEESKFDLKEISMFASHLNWLFEREKQSWRVTIVDRSEGDKRLNLVPIKIEYQDDAEDDITSEVA